ncbi:MFS transporter [Rhodococcus sp. NPDC019627]|uniref:MFS transporter n=1 Tax=unclassified Rhodococcus (in: high G+C Gram-positive bacteria) TaxID=192944 RepID=UPI00340F9113
MPNNSSCTGHTSDRAPLLGVSSGAALAAALLGMFVITLDALVVTVALPAIRNDLGGGMSGLQWVVDSYTLMFAALLLSAGALSDRVGARRAYGVGLAVFVAASAVCGLAPSLGILIAARLVQGAGAAVMLPASLALIRESYADPVKRARAIALWAVGGAVAAAAGPVAGGALNLISWRMIFFINLPAGIIALALLARTARSPRQPVPLDITGQATAVLAMGALTYGAIEAGAVGFTAPKVWAAGLVTVVALAIFLVAQARGRHPMVPLDLLRSRTVVVSSCAGFAFMTGFYGMVFLFSLYLQQLRGLSSLATGLVFLPMTVLTPFLNPLSARIAERFGPRLPIASGLFMMAAGLTILAFAPASTPTWLLAVLMLPVGLGGPLAMPPATALLINSVPAERTGTASGVFNTSRQLGGALAVAVFGALVADQATFSQGLHASLLIAALVLLLAAVASLLLESAPIPQPETPAPNQHRVNAPTQSAYATKQSG